MGEIGCEARFAFRNERVVDPGGGNEGCRKDSLRREGDEWRGGEGGVEGDELESEEKVRSVGSDDVAQRKWMKSRDRE